MAVLIEVRNSRGLVGRCDSRCYSAVRPGCRCVCEGMNHGVGLNQAVANNTEQAEWLAEITAERRCGVTERITRCERQWNLFG